jgi:enoyl-CoA hydratase/carnithine racemase
MPAELKSASHGCTMVLTISNPDQRNALGPEIYAAGIEAFNAAERNPDVRNVVITGEGAMFCAGGNLQRLLDNRRKPPQVQAESNEHLHSWIESVRTFPKPVIAAVEGAAAGAGFSLALACDFIVAAENAVFAMSYVNVALSPDGGATWSLARAMPRQLASELLMCGERTTAARLRELGIVNRITSPGSAFSEAMELARSLGERAPNALASIKELLNDAQVRTLDAQLAAERDHFVKNLHHANAGTAIEAFLAAKTSRRK